MEMELPQFFSGMVDLYLKLERQQRNISKAKKSISKPAFDLLAKNMSLSIELYDFLRQRLQVQARMLNILEE